MHCSRPQIKHFFLTENHAQAQVKGKRKGENFIFFSLFNEKFLFFSTAVTYCPALYRLNLVFLHLRYFQKCFKNPLDFTD